MLTNHFIASIHILLTIVSYPNSRITNEQLALNTNLSCEQIRKIVRKLKASNILIFKNGTGKPALAKNANLITLWDLYNSVEGEKFKNLNIFTSNIDCSILGENEKNVLIKKLEDAFLILKEKLSKTSIAQLKEEIDILNSQISF